LVQIQKMIETYSWKAAFFIQEFEDTFWRFLDELQASSIVGETDVGVLDSFFLILGEPEADGIYQTSTVEV